MQVLLFSGCVKTDWRAVDVSCCLELAYSECKLVRVQAGRDVVCDVLGDWLLQHSFNAVMQLHTATRTSVSIC